MIKGNKVVANPKILLGKPVIRGTRIPVYLVLNLLAAGLTFKKIIETYPQLKEDDIKSALEFAQAVVKNEEEINIPGVMVG